MTSIPPKVLLGTLLLAALLSAKAHAQCAYPNSERGEAPDWLCDPSAVEGASFPAVGDKSRMPSISLQNRLAGKQAMVAVLEKLFEHAGMEMQNRLPVEVSLSLPDATDWKRVARFKGIKVLDKTLSPVRHLYVLAGVPSEHRADLLRQARLELLKHNRGDLRKALSDEQWQQLQAWATGK